MVKPEHLAAAQTDEFLTRPAEKIANNVMDRLYLTGVVPVDDFCQPGRRQIFTKQGPDLAGDRLGFTISEGQGHDCEPVGD